MACDDVVAEPKPADQVPIKPLKERVALKINKGARHVVHTGGNLLHTRLTSCWSSSTGTDAM